MAGSRGKDYEADEEAEEIGVGGRQQELALAFHDADLHLVRVQEARCPEGRANVLVFHVVSSDTDQEILGIQLWINMRAPC